MATYTDNFNRASVGSDWVTVNAGTWSILSSTRLQQTNGAGVYRGVRYASPMDSADVDVSVIVRSGTSYNGAGILVRMSDSGTATADLDGYAILKFDNDTFYLVRFDNGDDGGVGYGYAWGTVTDNTDYTLRITVEGSTVTGYVDGTQRFQFTDTTYTGGSGNRSVALLSHAGGQYDDFSAEDISSGVTVTPGVASAVSSAANPTVVVGSAVTVTPAVASVVSSATNPSVIVPLVVSPAVASVRATAGNNALRFYGNGASQIDRVRIPLEDGASTQYPVNLGAGDFTVEFWINCLYADNSTTATDVRYSNALYDRDSWGEQRGHVIGVTRSGGNLVVCFGQAGSGLGWSTILGSTDVGDGDWHHVAVTRNVSTGLVTIWVDGASDTSDTYDTSDWSYPAGHTVGSGQDNEYAVLAAEKHDVGYAYDGLMDEIRLSNSVRYTGSFTPSTWFDPDANAVGLYHASSASGTVLHDSSTVSGAPTNGELLVGGTPTGPTWDTRGDVVLLGGISVTPAVASVVSSAANPVVVYGALAVSPGIASAASSATNPTVIQGEPVTVSPGVAGVVSSATNPTTILGASSVTPGIASIVSSASSPSVVLGAINITPATASVVSSAVDPTVIQGEPIVVSPAVASVASSAVDPTAVLGAISLAPAIASVVSSGVDPTVTLGAVSVTPGLASVISSAIDPTVVQGEPVVVSPGIASQVSSADVSGIILGSISITSAVASVVSSAIDPLVSSGPVTMTPAIASVVSSAIDPTVDTGTGVTLTPDVASIVSSGSIGAATEGPIALSPAAANVVSSAANPSIILGAVSVIPSTAFVVGGAISPTVALGATTASPDAAIAVTTAVSPTVLEGAIIVSPDAAAATSSALEPTVILGPDTLTPSAGVVVSSAVNPVVIQGNPVTVSPDVSIVVSSAIDPTVILGAVTISPEYASVQSSAIEPLVSSGSILFTPGVATVVTSAVSPTVVISFVQSSTIGSPYGSAGFIGAGVSPVEFVAYENPVVMRFPVSVTISNVEALRSIVAATSTNDVVHIVVPVATNQGNQIEQLARVIAATQEDATSGIEYPIFA